MKRTANYLIEEFCHKLLCVLKRELEACRSQISIGHCEREIEH
jgi:hypothetical protein